MSPEDYPYSEPERRYDPYQQPGPDPRYDNRQGQYPQGQYSQDGYDQQGYDQQRGYDPRDRYEPDDEPPSGPSKGRLIGIFAGLAILALLAGAGAAKLFGGKDTSSTASAVPTTSQTTAPALISVAQTPTEQPSSSASSASPSPTAPPDYHPIPPNAASLKGLDFGFLTKVTSNNGRVSIRFDRAYFYTGAEATKRNHGTPPDDDYLIENSNPELRTFVLDPKASVVATDRLLTTAGSSSSETLTLAQFVKNSQTAFSTSTAPVPVWLRHTNGLTGQVTALAEQYLP